jgi:thiol-disulfide isomerase/thioredoxin
MLERLLIAAIVVAGVAAALWAVKLALRWRDRRIVTRLREAGPIETESGTPRIVYFTTTSCVVCRLQQQPAIEDLRRELPEIVIEKHDAVEEGELADEFGVLSVPTTAVYDRSGELVTINRGFAPVAQLYAQATGSEQVAEGGVAMASERIERPQH